MDHHPKRRGWSLGAVLLTALTACNSNPDDHPENGETVASACATREGRPTATFTIEAGGRTTTLEGYAFISEERALSMQALCLADDPNTGLPGGGLGNTATFDFTLYDPIEVGTYTEATPRTGPGADPGDLAVNGTRVNFKTVTQVSSERMLNTVDASNEYEDDWRGSFDDKATDLKLSSPNFVSKFTVQIASIEALPDGGVRDNNAEILWIAYHGSATMEARAIKRQDGETAADPARESATVHVEF